MNAGDTFLFVGSDDDHLYMIISDPAVDASRVVIVCFLSYQPHHDQACVLDAGEHAFIKHTTCVNYRDAHVVTLAQLEYLQQNNRLKLKVPLSTQLLQKIRERAENGDLPTKAYEVLREQGFVL